LNSGGASMGNMYNRNSTSKTTSRTRGNPRQKFDLNESTEVIMSITDRNMGEGYI